MCQAPNGISRLHGADEGSCGSWGLPCRVYLVGGAQATGTHKDTAVVYTPSVLDNGIYMSNIMLPEGMFWSDVIEDPSKQLLYWCCVLHLHPEVAPHSLPCMTDPVHLCPQHTCFEVTSVALLWAGKASELASV